MKKERENMYKKYSTVYAGKELELEFGRNMQTKQICL